MRKHENTKTRVVYNRPKTSQNRKIHLLISNKCETSWPLYNLIRFPFTLHLSLCKFFDWKKNILKIGYLCLIIYFYSFNFGFESPLFETFHFILEKQIQVAIQPETNTKKPDLQKLNHNYLRFNLRQGCQQLC